MKKIPKKGSLAVLSHRPEEETNFDKQTNTHSQIASLKSQTNPLQRESVNKHVIGQRFASWLIEHTRICGLVKCSQIKPRDWVAGGLKEYEKKKN